MDTVTEITEAQRAERAKIREDAELFDAMIATPAWKRYIALVEVVGQNFYRGLMEPLADASQVTKTEYTKGVLVGLSTATTIPQMKVREAQELRGTTDIEE
jgi:hypothetical protein